MRVRLFCLGGVLLVLSSCSDTPAQPSTATTTPSTAVPVVLDAPAPIAPLTGSSATGWPTFIVSDAKRTGSPGAISYRFEVATSATFSPTVVTATVPETLGQTVFMPPLNTIPPFQTALFWRVSALDPAHSITSPASGVQNVTIDFPDQVRLAAQENSALWPGEQPPAGSYGPAALGANWQVQTLSAFFGGTFVSPPLEVLQLIDLVDRGMNPGEALVWQNSHGYPTDAVYYPNIVGGVVGYHAFYIALTNGRWDLIVRSGA